MIFYKSLKHCCVTARHQYYITNDHYANALSYIVHVLYPSWRWRHRFKKKKKHFLKEKDIDANWLVGFLERTKEQSWNPVKLNSSDSYSLPLLTCNQKYLLILQLCHLTAYCCFRSCRCWSTFPYKYMLQLHDMQLIIIVWNIKFSYLTNVCTNEF